MAETDLDESLRSTGSVAVHFNLSDPNNNDQRGVFFLTVMSVVLRMMPWNKENFVGMQLIEKVDFFSPVEKDTLIFCKYKLLEERKVDNRVMAQIWVLYILATESNDLVATARFRVLF